MSTEENKIEEKKESICTVVAEILKESCTLKEEESSLFELQQRQKINKHLSECKNYNCYLERVERINKGLY